jgi:hypothetical protein
VNRPYLQKGGAPLFLLQRQASRLHSEVELAAGTAASTGKTTPELIAAVFTSYFG